MKTLIVLCEGAHDHAFLTRLLAIAGYGTYEDTPTQLPHPIRDVICRELSGLDLSDNRLDQIRVRAPGVLIHDEIYVVIYELGGNRNIQRARELVSKYKEGFSQPLVSPAPPGSGLGFLVVTDADESTPGDKAAEVRRDYSEVFAEHDGFEHRRVFGEGAYPVGLYIVSKDMERGRLDDVIVDMIRDGHPSLLEQVEVFISTHEGAYCPRDRPQDRGKMKIGIAGQLEKPGSTNSVIIRHSKLVSPDALREHRIYDEMIGLISDIVRDM